MIDGNVLPAVSKVKKLGITFHSNLLATSHVMSVVFTANQRVNLLLRSFLTRNKSVLVKAYIAYVRSILEYGFVVWSAYKTSNISYIKQVQRSFTKRVPDLKNVAYRDRLAVTNLEIFESRRFYADLVMCYKIVFKLISVDFCTFFSFCTLKQHSWSPL